MDQNREAGTVGHVIE